MLKRWEKAGDWTTTQAETRYGCFLPDLTGLARDLSIASLPAGTITVPVGRQKAPGAGSARGVKALESNETRLRTTDGHHCPNRPPPSAGFVAGGAATGGGSLSITSGAGAWRRIV